MQDNQKNKWKVYAHISPKGKTYVGITSQQDPQKRWKHGNGYKYNHHLFNAFKKYGWDGFQHIILFEDLPEEEAKQIEIELIKKFHLTNPECGYNISPGNQYDYHFGKAKSIPVCQFTLNGDYLKTFPSLSEAARSVGSKCPNHISEVCRGELYSAYNYIWAFKENCEDLDLFKSKCQERIKQRNKSRKHRKIRKNKVYQLDNDYNVVHEFDHVKIASEYFDLPNDHDIRNACNRHHQTHGFYWLYEKDYNDFINGLNKWDFTKLNKRKVLQFTLDGELIGEFESCKEAAKSCNANSSVDISQACSGKAQSSHGYIWRYKDKYNNEQVSLNYKNRKPIVQFTKDGDFVAKYRSIGDASVEKTFNAEINACCHNRLKTAYGFIWKFEEDCELQNDGTYKILKR